MNPLAFLGTATVVAAAAPAVVDEAALDKAFEALRTYRPGSSRGVLAPLDAAVVASLTDAAARKQLEQRLTAVLKTEASLVAKEYVCGKLGLIGSAAAVPALAGLLAAPDLSNQARSALEVMPCPEASQALRDSLPKLSGLQKVGVINSLGMRRDSGSVPALAALLADPDKPLVSAAAAALGEIGTAEAGQALQQFQPKATAAIRPAVADACLTCAERLLANGKKAEAQAIYKLLDDPQQPKHVRAAAQRGLSQTAGKK